MHRTKLASLVVLVVFLLTVLIARADVAFDTLISLSSTNPPNWGAGGLSTRLGAMVQAPDGNLYGTCHSGGYTPSGTWAGYGTVFRLTPAGIYSVVHFFGTVTNGLVNGYEMDGYLPTGDLTVGADGNIYGTVTTAGGSTHTVYPQGYGSMGGAVFQVTTNGDFTLTHAFADDVYYDLTLSNYVARCGTTPAAGVTMGRDGNLYGTTSAGAFYNRGAIYHITSAGAGVVEYLFPTNYAPGGLISELVEGPDGAYYGTTEYGGAYGYGSIFRFVPGTDFRTIYSFNVGPDGAFPLAGLCKGRDGYLYGTTSTSIPAYNYGTVFQIATNGSLATLHAFNSLESGATPHGVIQGSDGGLYGTTHDGGTNYNGIIYRVTTNGVFTLLHTFGPLTGGINGDGSGPMSALVQADNGSFYGLTQKGGAYGYGTVFRLTLTAPGPIVQTLTVTNGSVTLTWNATAGRAYQVQYNADLISTNWVNLGNSNVASQATLTTTDSIGSSSARFYRIVQLP